MSCILCSVSHVLDVCKNLNSLDLSDVPYATQKHCEPRVHNIRCESFGSFCMLFCGLKKKLMLLFYTRKVISNKKKKTRNSNGVVLLSCVILCFSRRLHIFNTLSAYVIQHMYAPDHYRWHCFIFWILFLFLFCFYSAKRMNSFCFWHIYFSAFFPFINLLSSL